MVGRHGSCGNAEANRKLQNAFVFESTSTAKHKKTFNVCHQKRLICQTPIKLPKVSPVDQHCHVFLHSSFRAFVERRSFLWERPGSVKSGPW